MTRTRKGPVASLPDAKIGRPAGQPSTPVLQPGSPSELADRAQRLADELTVLRRDLLSLGAKADVLPIPMTAPTLLSPTVAADYLMVSRTTIFGLIKSGELTSVLIGSARRIPRSACDNYVAGLLSARQIA